MNEIEPIRASVTVSVDASAAFELFTEHLEAWWPLQTHSWAAGNFEGQGVKVERIEFQGRVGGLILEHLSNGEVLPWGEVTEWEPPARLLIAWKPNSTPSPPTELEVRFTPEGAGTLVELEHRGWGRLGEIALEARAEYVTGWAKVLGLFREEANREVA